MRVVFAAIVAIFGAWLAHASANDHEPNARRDLLVGRWYGEYQDDEQNLVQFNVLRKSGGTYAVVFRRFAVNGAPYEESEAGRWTLEGDTYSTTFEAWYPLASWERSEDWPAAGIVVLDEYRVISLTQDVFEYKHLGTHAVYRAVRVADDFEFPEPPPVSAQMPEESSRSKEPPEAARKYIEEVAPLLAEHFKSICLQSPNDPARLAQIADAAKWPLNYERMNKGVTYKNWMSPGGLKAMMSGGKVFILDVSFEPKKSPTTVTCAISIFGATPDPAVARQEFDLIKKELAKTFTLGETTEAPPDLSKPSKPQFHVISTPLEREENDLTELNYTWAGGVHSPSSLWTARVD